MKGHRAEPRDAPTVGALDRWSRGAWSSVPEGFVAASGSATARMATIAAHTGRPPRFDALADLAFAPTSWLDAVVRTADSVPPRHRRWLAWAAMVLMARRAEAREDWPAAYDRMWNEVVARDPQRHLTLRSHAAVLRTITHDSLKKIAAFAPERAEGMLLAGLERRPLSSFFDEPLATFRYLGAATTPAAIDAALALLARAQAARVDDDFGHLGAGVRGLADARAFVDRYVAAGGTRYRKALSDALAGRQRRTRVGPDYAAMVAALARCSRVQYAQLRSTGLTAPLRQAFDEADHGTRLRIARAPQLAKDPVVSEFLLDEGDATAFDLGASRVLGGGLPLDPKHAARALSFLDRAAPRAATLELLARLDPKACMKFASGTLHKLSPEYYGVVAAALLLLPKRTKATDNKLRKHADKHPVALLPLAAQDEACLASLLEPVGRMATPAGALLSVPSTAAAVAWLERQPTDGTPNLIHAWLSLEARGAAAELRAHWLGQVGEALTDPQRADWATDVLARLGPRPDCADAIANALLEAERMDRRLVHLLVDLGDPRAWSVVEAAAKKGDLSGLGLLATLDVERAARLAETFVPPATATRDEQDDALFHLEALGAVAPVVPAWLPAARIREYALDALRLRRAAINDGERTKILRAICKRNGTDDLARSLATAREALANFPEAMTPILRKAADAKSVALSVTATEALAVDVCATVNRETAFEPTFGRTDTLGRKWHAWYTQAFPAGDYVPPFHPQWAEARGLTP